MWLRTYAVVCEKIKRALTHPDATVTTASSEHTIIWREAETESVRLAASGMQDLDEGDDVSQKNQI